MPPRALLTGHLAVGLVNVPTRLYTATRSEGIAFHLLHERCGSRIQTQSYCPVCNAIVPREELVRGFEFAKDEYVRITDEELKAFESQDGRVIEATAREGGTQGNRGKDASGRAQAAPRVLAQVAGDDFFLTHLVHTPIFSPVGGPRC